MSWSFLNAADASGGEVSRTGGTESNEPSVVRFVEARVPSGCLSEEEKGREAEISLVNDQWQRTQRPPPSEHRNSKLDSGLDSGLDQSEMNEPQSKGTHELCPHFVFGYIQTSLVPIHIFEVFYVRSVSFSRPWVVS